MGPDNNPSQQLYEILGLAPGATVKEIKKAFRRLAKTLHPDKNSSADATEKFKELNNAYAELLLHTKNQKLEHDKKPDLEKKMTDIKVKEHTHCVVVNIGKENIQNFLLSCQELYGVPKDQGVHGRKFSRPYTTLGDDTQNLGMIHITVYMTTGNVMAQGSCYLLWHAEYLPYLVEKMESVTRKLCIENSDQSEDSERNDQSKSSQATIESSCSICDASTSMDMLQCDACNTWLHYACSKVFPEPELRKLVDIEETVYVCWNCEEMVTNDKALCLSHKVTPREEISTITAIIQSLERNLVDHMNVASSDTIKVLQEKHLTETELLKERYKNEKLTLTNQIKMLESKIGELQSRRPSDTSERTDQIRKSQEKIAQLQAQVLNAEEKCDHLKEQNSTLQSLKKQLEGRIKDLTRQVAQHDEEKNTLKTKLEEAEENNRSVVNMNQKLNNEMWSLKREMQNKNNNENDTISENAQEVVVESTEEQQTVNTITTTEEHRDMRTQGNNEAGEGGDGREETTQRTKRKAGHIVVTSSLGKDLDAKKIAPNSENRVYVKAMSGARINNIKNFIEHTPFQHKSVTVLVGGNDVDSGKTVQQCCDEFKLLLDSIRSNNPDAIINLVEIPPRINNEDVKGRIYDLNQWLSNYCMEPENDDCYFIRNGLDESPRFYQGDKIHLSCHKGGGASRLAMSIRMAVMSCETPIEGPGQFPPSPSQNEQWQPAPQRRWQNGYRHRNKTLTSREMNYDPRPRPNKYAVANMLNDLFYLLQQGNQRN